MCVGGGGEGGRQSSLEDDMEGNVPEGCVWGWGEGICFLIQRHF